MVRLSVSLDAGPTRPIALVETFRSLMSTTRFQRGCLDCSAWIEPDDSVGYTELWATEADLRRYVRSDSFTSLLNVIELARKATVQFDFVSRTRGLDYVAEVRGAVATSH
jgi:hypothetical protein